MTTNRTGGRFESALRAGKFVVTAEISPPDSTDPQDVLKAAGTLGRIANALNITDGSGANCHISSVAACTILSQAGYEVIFQMSCRDRNRIAMQGELLGASALGLHNVLCLTGDDVTAGDHPQAKRVFDLDSTQLIQTARILRDDGIFLSGRKLLARPKFFLGGADNPFVEPFEFRPLRMAKKIQAGAEFFQTQYCFDVERLKSHMQKVCDLGLNEKSFILIGVGPLRSEKTAEFLRTKVPGVYMPDKIVERMRKVPSEKKREEGKKICLEIIQQVREIKGVSGIHMMAYKQEEAGAEILEEAGLIKFEEQSP